MSFGRTQWSRLLGWCFLIACSTIYISAQPTGRLPGTDNGTCTEWINGKWRQVKCRPDPVQPSATTRNEPEPITLPPPDPRFEQGSDSFAKGNNAYTAKDWRLAVFYFQRAVEKVPENETYKKWLVAAEARLKELVERERVEKARIEAEAVANRQAPGILKPLPVESPDDSVIKRFPGSDEEAESVLKPLRIPRDDRAAKRRKLELDRLIARDVQAIRRLGFDRRAADFIEWEKLAAEEKANFEAKVIDEIKGTLVDLAKGEKPSNDELLIKEVDLTLAALYNNATQRVARREVVRLTKLTEVQLKSLVVLQRLLSKRVIERNRLRKRK